MQTEGGLTDPARADDSGGRSDGKAPVQHRVETFDACYELRVKLDTFVARRRATGYFKPRKQHDSVACDAEDMPPAAHARAAKLSNDQGALGAHAVLSIFQLDETVDHRMLGSYIAGA